MIERTYGAVASLRPASVASSATVTLVFDTIGHEYAVVRVHKGTQATTSAQFSVLKITESDTLTSVSSQSAIVALTGGTATSASVGFVIPVATSNDGGGIIEFQIALPTRKRYLGVQVTPGQTTVVGASADLFRSKQFYDTAATRTLSNSGATSDGGLYKIVSA